MLNVNELLKDLEIGEYGVEFENYKRGYICDIISEIADRFTSIYYCDIIKFISENVEQVNDTISEFGWDGAGSDLYKAGQLAEYCSIQNEIYNDIEDILKHWALKYYVQYTDNVEISEEIAETIENIEYNTFDKLDEICDFIVEKVNEENEDCEEL
jgi:hypothetical protein